MIKDGFFQFQAYEYLGHKLFFVADSLYIEDPAYEGGYQFFGIPGGDKIVSVIRRTPPEKPIEHLEVNTKDHQFVLVGGPEIEHMYLVPIK